VAVIPGGDPSVRLPPIMAFPTLLYSLVSRRPSRSRRVCDHVVTRDAPPGRTYARYSPFRRALRAGASAAVDSHPPARSLSGGA